MSEDTSDLTVTLKAGTGYDVPWIVVRGDNPDEVEFKLNNIDGVIAATIDASNKFKAAANVAPIVAGGSVAQATVPPTEQPKQQAWGQTPAAAQQGAAPAQNGPRLHPTDTCAVCGQRPQEKDVFRKSDNKKFEFWTCPNQRSRDDGHYSAFRN